MSASERPLNNGMILRKRNLSWAFSGVTTIILLYGLLVIASQYTPMPDESVRERFGGVVFQIWFALPFLFLLIGQVFLARTEAARFAVLLTALIVTGALVVLSNGPQSSGYLSYRPADSVTTILFFGVTMPPVGLSLLGLWIAMLLSRSHERPGDDRM